MKTIINRLLYLALLSFAVTPVCAQKLQKSVTWENIKEHPAPLPVVGRIAPVESRLDAESLWSVGSETLDRDFADFEKYKGYMSETGVGYARLQSGWAKTEQKKGKYDFSWIDAHVDGLIAEGIKPWVCLCYGNPIYSEHGITLNAEVFSDGPVMDAWLRYVKACVKRYKGKVSMWEVWNEPDGRKGNTPALYANLFVKTAKIIRQIDPDAKICAFGLMDPTSAFARRGLEEIAKADGIKYIDCMTYHAYLHIPELIVPFVSRLRKEVDKYNPSIVLLQGEAGCPGQYKYAYALEGYEWDEYSQAKWELRQSLNHFGMGVPYSFFTIVDLNYGYMLQAYGLIRMNADKTPIYKRPKFYAVQHVTGVFTPDMKSTDEVVVAGPDDLQITSYGLQKAGKNVGCMLWAGGNRPTSLLERVPMEIGISGMKFEDPVYVDMLTGFVHELNVLDREEKDGCVIFNGLPVWDSPVLVIERSAVNIKNNN
jgi:hypothetical protein